MKPNIVTAMVDGQEQYLRETVSALYAVSLLGSFMHAAPRQESTVELAVGGLAALAPHRLAAIVWYSQGREHRMRVLGRLPTGDVLPPDLAGARQPVLLPTA